MHKIVLEHLTALKLGDPQQSERLTIIPLLMDSGEGPSYATLKEALGQGVLIVTEVDSGGSVPHLKAINSGDVPVLILDGEELVGAKQNRILNTTVLLREKSETIIPVSCTERGRWAHISPAFADSDVSMPPRMRASNLGFVASSLETSREFRSSQSHIWDEVEDMAAATGVSSPTHAMRDVFESRSLRMDGVLEAVALTPGQSGLLAAIGGQVVGFDLISCPQAYARLHAKLVRSYGMESMLRQGRDGSGLSPGAAQAFIARAMDTKATDYPSVGHGRDVRFRGETMVGSALVHEDTPIHIAFFHCDDDRVEDPMAPSARRRGFRT